MAVKLFLNSKTILDHTFPIINANALDMIIQDYKLVEANVVVPLKEYESLTNKNKVLESEKRKIEVELERYKARFTNIKSSDNVTTDNIELVRKINALEKFLWAHGYNPDTIK